MNTPIPNFIDCVRMFRKEFNLTFEEAVRRTKREFEKKGWTIPDSMKGLYK